MIRRLELDGTIASNTGIKHRDTLNTKKALNGLGFYKAPAGGLTGVSDRAMFAGIKRFQRQTGLRADGVVTPNGPTLTKLNAALARRPADGGERPREAARAKEAGDRTKRQPPKVEWDTEAVRALSVGGRTFDTTGPVRVQMVNDSLHPDGLRYNVVWHALDADGNVVPEVRSADNKPVEHGGHVSPWGGVQERVFEPPYDNPYGFRVRVWIPPQAANSGNSAGPYLNIFPAKKPEQVR